MRACVVSLLLLLLTWTHGLQRGKDYFKEKVCNEYNALGEMNFRSISIVINSRKYSNATFEQIISLVNEMVDLGKKCCADGADPDCYENESTAFSEKSCHPDAPFPRHPGIAGCCTQQGLARKLCLAALKHHPKDFPTYVEPTNEEICEAFKKDPQGFAERFLVEYSSDYSYAPLPILLNATRNYLSAVRTCCASTQNNICFLKERLQHKPIQTFTHLSNKACALYALLGKNKTTVSYLIKFTQQTPSLSFENAISLAGEAAEILSKCCASLEENCLHNELKPHIAHICNTACGANEGLQACCRSKDDVGKYLCIYSLPWVKHSHVPQAPSSVDEGVCREDGEVDIYRNIYDMARIYSRAPEALLITLYSAGQAAANDCCGLADPKACFAEKGLKTIALLHTWIEKGNEICGEYTDHTYVEFLKRLRANALTLFPPGTLDAENQVSALVEQRSSYATKCCHLNAPPAYCGIQKEEGIERK
ncbi:vitamin D-binding protein isoform X2 [Thamnophis elegans]|uniref:vitamin D-binding protein isoform X2 n=1 Tax=Thamnophis elegans TaxID=35005 RepID=UPI001377A749|nr:vitamin D-binding protein isoform X2 [Thamnophis elegans]